MTDEATLPPQDFGPYRLEALLGAGSMGEVHRAYDSRTERHVALKLLAEHLGDDAQFRERFRRECYATARLREPHIIPIHQWGEIEGRLYLDMRLVDGEDLRSVLLRDGALPPERAAEIISQVARALDAAHADGLVHRDVKPSNVLIAAHRGNDFVYLVDFGIANSVDPSTSDPLTGTGEMLGSINYIAPERFRQHAVDGRCDVYSLACVLFQCLTGRAPFAGGSLADTMHSHLMEPPPRVTDLRSDLPREFDEVLAHGMAKDPEQRYSSAGALAVAARDAARHRPAPAAAPPAPAAPAPPIPRAPDPPPPRPQQPIYHLVDEFGADRTLLEHPPTGAPPGYRQSPEASPGYHRAPWWLLFGADLVLAALLIAAIAFLLTRG